MDTLITKYRPQTLAEVIGQEHAVEALTGIIKKKSSRGFLFVGPAGTGKTTLGRIVMRDFGCDPRDLTEVDAASNTGIDAMRDLTSRMNYRPMYGKCRGIIIDEAHALSKQAWDAALKATEEPSSHCVWAFCTTNAAKVPDTIVTRCATFHLSPVSPDDIFDLLKKVAGLEGFTCPDKVIDLIAQKSRGSPRRALSFLATCANVVKLKTAAKLLREVLEGDDAVIELCRALAKGCDWKIAMGLVKKLGDTQPESARIIIFSYFTSMATNSSGQRAQQACSIMSAFEQPFPSQSEKGSLVLALARILLE